MSIRNRTTIELKRARAVHANALISSIASYGRKFFRHEDTVAQIFVQPSGRVFLLDEYTRTLIYTHYRGHWKGFNHGGTLQNIICLLRDYIMTGKQINIRYICAQRSSDGSNIWGYSESEASALRKEVASNPCIHNPDQLSETETNEAASALDQVALKFPIGTKVKYFPVLGGESFTETHVTSEPWDLCGSIVVKLDGKAGGFDVEHLEVM